MHRFHRIGRSVFGLTLAGALAACSGGDNNEVLGPKPAGANNIFQNYVALGNSITAGFQSSGINDSTQRRSYAVLLAAQMGTRFAYPSLAGRGCAPPVINFSTQARAGTGSTSSTCDLRNPAGATDILNNVAVPGARVADLTAAGGTTASNTLTSLFLGGKSQVQKAVQAAPTFASIFIGGNDVLAAAATGFISPTAGVSPGITPQASFVASFTAIIDGLTANAPNLQGVLAGVPNVNNIPLFFAVGVIQASAAARAGFDQAAGRVATSTDPYKAAALTIDANCTGASTTLVAFPIASAITRFRNDTSATGQPPKDPALRMQAGGLPPHIACGVSGAPWPAPVGEAGILTVAEQATIATAIADYNTYISSEATRLGWAYMNPNVLLDSLRLAGAVPTFPNLLSATATFGAWLSLDGFHPSTLAHRALTNHMINAINAKYGTALVRISVP